MPTGACFPRPGHGQTSTILHATPPTLQLTYYNPLSFDLQKITLLRSRIDTTTKEITYYSPPQLTIIILFPAAEYGMKKTRHILSTQKLILIKLRSKYVSPGICMRKGFPIDI
ncbi:unnamed protein product [Orchesella dallaii]|uniref:Uncharacterized protein n=1 Tax=Orchesella dallaii TaxID=48710 RepID=A0ABP1SAE5_9HEXA